tara:strand:+ start:6081 stop:6329 length:249 start_codon:yes stop_codon:yes gene_type:complete
MNNDVRREINQVINALESEGVDVNSHMTQKDTKGLGDVVEATLQRFGVTEEKFKKWFNLKECNCTKRKKWLNGLFSWKVGKK